MLLRRPRLALFLPTSHYGLRLEPSGQLAFAALDLIIATLLYRLHVRWTPLPAPA